MFRSTLIAAGAVVLCSTAGAQQALDPGKIFPITPEIEKVQVDWGAKKALRDNPNTLEGGYLTHQQIFNNTCTWTVGGFFTSAETCDTFYDEGRVPSTSDPAYAAVPGVSDDNEVTSFNFGYCTFAITGTVDIKIGFIDSLLAPCLLNVPATPTGAGIPGIPTAVAYFDFGAPSGFFLPGSTTTAALACYSIDIFNFGFCLTSDGDGTWDNDGSTDYFWWTYTYENGDGAGPILSGEPATDPGGACTYNIPCATDALYGNPCGTGLDIYDNFWINVDGDTPGSTVNTGAMCPGAPSAGSGCYFFGGYPGGPYSGFWMIMRSAGPCGTCHGDVINYCTSGTTTAGCRVTMGCNGTPSASFTGTFELVATGMESKKNGTFYYSLNGPAANVWGTKSPPATSFQCVSFTGSQRTGNVLSTVGTDCLQTTTKNMHAYWIAKPGAAGQPLQPGDKIWAQLWFRDPPNIKQSSLSDALRFTMCP
jgi:hypothetical protein